MDIAYGTLDSKNRYSLGKSSLEFYLKIDIIHQEGMSL